VDRRARALARAAPPTSPPLLTPTVHGTSSPGTLSVASGMPLAPATVLPAASAAAAAAATSGGGDTSSISTPNTGRPSACAPATRRRRTDAPGRRTRNACDAWTRPGEETRSWARGRPPLDSICGDGCVCVWRGGSSRWLRDRQSDFERSAPPPRPPPAPPFTLYVNAAWRTTSPDRRSAATPSSPVSPGASGTSFRTRTACRASGAAANTPRKRGGAAKVGRWAAEGWADPERSAGAARSVIGGRAGRARCGGRPATARAAPGRRQSAPAQGRQQSRRRGGRGRPHRATPPAPCSPSPSSTSPCRAGWSPWPT